MFLLTSCNHVLMLIFSGGRSFDESTWGAFDNNDDVDSVWGFNPAKAKVNPNFPKHSWSCRNFLFSHFVEDLGLAS